MDYNLLFRWFLDMDIIEDSFDHSVFTKNRERLMEHEVGSLFFDAVANHARDTGPMSDDHFTVDGTLIDAWTSPLIEAFRGRLKSFRPKGEDPSLCPTDGDKSNPTIDFSGEKRSNETHSSTTDPENRLIMRKSLGDKAKLSYGAHALMENRNGLLVDIMVTRANRSSEWNACEDMLTR